MSDTFKNSELGEGLTAKGVLFVVIIALLFRTAIFAVGYALRGVSAYKMAKRKGVKNAGLAFVPVAYFFILGKLQDDGVPEQRRNLLVYIAITLAACSIACAVTLDIIFSLPVMTYIFAHLGDFSTVVSSDTFVADSAAVALNFVLEIAYRLTSLAFSISAIMIYMNVYRAYYPEKANKYSIIAVAVDVFFGTSLLYAIFLFVMRDRERVGYAQYLSRRSERFYGGYNRNYGNPYYRGGYGEQYRQDRYGANNDRDAARKDPAQEPFSEFTNQPDDEPFTFGDENGGRQTDDKKDDEDDLFR